MTSESLFAPVEILLSQGSGRLQNLSSRILYVSLWVKSLILLPLYTGAVVSLLTIRIPFLPFEDLTGFLEDGTYRLIAENYTFQVRYFQVCLNSHKEAPHAGSLFHYFFPVGV